LTSPDERIPQTGQVARKMVHQRAKQPASVIEGPTNALAGWPERHHSQIETKTTRALCVSSQGRNHTRCCGSDEDLGEF